MAQVQPQKPPEAAAPPPPAKVDRALRERIRMFYQALVDGKPRLADPLVAEDSKDIFFGILKPRYLSFEIRSITYSDKFARAQVSVDCEEDFLMMGLGNMRVKMPRLSRWKLEHGRWYWYVDTKADRQTPFGVLKPMAKNEASPSAPLAIPQGPTPEQVLKQVAADKSEVVLNTSGPSSDVVTVTNGMPGWVRLGLELPRIPIPGFEVKLDRTDVQGNQTARVTFRYEPKDDAPKPNVMVNVTVDPTGEIIPIRVTFRAPAAAKDQQQ